MTAAIMDEITRSELEKLHGRIGDLKERVVSLEAQQPHINATLLRIEGGIEKLGGRIWKAVGAVALLFMTPMAVILVKAALSGSLSQF
jgi:hypothetical protein